MPKHTPERKPLWHSLFLLASGFAVFGRVSATPPEGIEGDSPTLTLLKFKQSGFSGPCDVLATTKGNTGVGLLMAADRVTAYTQGKEANKAFSSVLETGGCVTNIRSEFAVNDEGKEILKEVVITQKLNDECSLKLTNNNGALTAERAGETPACKITYINGNKFVVRAPDKAPVTHAETLKKQDICPATKETIHPLLARPEQPVCFVDMVTANVKSALGLS